MAGPQLVKTLTTKYAKLLGEHEFAERPAEIEVGLDAITEAWTRIDARKKDIEEKLAAIETVIWMFDANWDPARVHPTKPQRDRLNPGSIARTAYAALRDAKIPMTSREIARVVSQRLGYRKIEEREIARIDTAVYAALSGREGTTIMIVSREPIRWSIIPRDQAQARAKAPRRAPHAVPPENEAPCLRALSARAS